MHKSTTLLFEIRTQILFKQAINYVFLLELDLWGKIKRFKS